MEARFERKNRRVWRAWSQVEHHRAHIFLRWLHMHTSTLLLRMAYERQFIGSLQRAGTAHGTSHTVQTFWGNIKERRLDQLSVFLWWCKADTCSGAKEMLHCFRFGRFQQLWVIIAQADTADGREHIQELVAICIRDVIAYRFVKVDGELDLLFARNICIAIDIVQGLWARERCLHSGKGRLFWESLFGHGYLGLLLMDNLMLLWARAAYLLDLGKEKG